MVIHSFHCRDTLTHQLTVSRHDCSLVINRGKICTSIHFLSYIASWALSTHLELVKVLSFGIDSAQGAMYNKRCKHTLSQAEDGVVMLSLGLVNQSVMTQS